MLSRKQQMVTGIFLLLGLADVVIGLSANAWGDILWGAGVATFACALLLSGPKEHTGRRGLQYVLICAAVVLAITGFLSKHGYLAALSANG